MTLIKEHVPIVTNKQVWTRIKHIPSNKKNYNSQTSRITLVTLRKGENHA